MGWVLPGGLEGPPSRASGGRHGEACGATKIPALPETTDPVREGGGAEKRSCCSWAVQAQRPGLWYMGCQDEAKKFLTPPPNPGLGSCPGPSTIIPCPAPARSPPNNNQRKRKRCHLPMPALRVSKPSGMGGARQLLGAWRGGGLPGGGTRDRLPGAPKLT